MKQKDQVIIARLAVLFDPSVRIDIQRQRVDVLIHIGSIDSISSDHQQKGVLLQLMLLIHIHQILNESIVLNYLIIFNFIADS